MPPKSGLGSNVKRRRESDEIENEAGLDDMQPSPSKKSTPDDKRKLAPMIKSKSKAIITKIRMKDFNAYEDIVVEPGPGLNLVVGPNGSGKSTIVNAIVFGLAGNCKQIIDRHQKDSGFVRNGADRAVVEIWLKSGVGQRDVHIKRTVESQSNTSTYYINDRKVTASEVQQYTKSNNIKLDNLCHYLPQEKVQEMADKVSKPTEMLFELERAVGPPWMLELHEELIKEQDKGKNLLRDQDAFTVELAGLRQKETNLREEMERHDEKARLEQELYYREKKLPWVKYTACRQRKKEKAEAHEVARKDFSDKAREHNQIKEQSDVKENLLKKAKNDIDKYEWAANKIFKEDLQKTETQDQELCVEENAKIALLKDMDKRARKQESDIAHRQAERDKLKEKLKTAGPPPKDIDAKIHKKNQEYKAVSEEMTLLQRKQRDRNDSARALHNQIQAKQNVLDSYQDPRKVKMDALARDRYTKPLYDIRVWLDQNADKFEKNVFGPICLELEVETQLDGKYVESCLGARGNDFIVQTQKDFDRLHELLRSDPTLKSLEKSINIVNASSVRPWERSFEDVEPLKKHGVEGFLVDRVKADPMVMNVACALSGLARALVGTNKAYDDAYTMMNLQELITVGANRKKYHKVAGGGCYTPKGSIFISFSIYGNQNASTDRREYHFAAGKKVTPGQSDDTERMLADLSELKVKHREAQESVQEMEGEMQELRVKTTKIDSERQELKELKQGAGALQSKINHLEKTIKDIASEDHFKDKARVEKELGQITSRRVAALCKIEEHVKKMCELRKQALIAELRTVTLQQEVAECREKVKALRIALDQADKLVKNLEAQFEEVKAEYNQLKRQCQKLNEGEMEIFSQLPNDVIDLETEIEKYKMDIDALGVPTDRRRELEQTCARITELATMLGSGQGMMERHRAEVLAKKNKLLDGDGEDIGLRAIVKKVNENFGRSFAEMGNCGEIRLAETMLGEQDDFANWKLEILVMFRGAHAGGGQMHLLSHHSGGEKSVTIMLFIIALQELTDCPFRVVDEINQGMDAHNEKAVFDKVVEYSCQHYTSQTFLITPKLQGDMLTKLKDHVTVLCVMKGLFMLESGAWVQGGLLPFQALGIAEA